jgi:predicted TIM-barrel fold metal-dependent hydrolase
MGEIASLGVPLAVHTGVRGDFREFDPQHFIPFFLRHPELRFDLFHMGIPYVRAMGRIAANFRNVWVNLCWAPTVSATMATNALDEWLDMVPVNKIIGFGSDVRWPVEKVYGHLTLARQTIATVLGRRIDRGMMSRDEALQLASRWLCDNAVELYGLKSTSGRLMQSDPADRTDRSTIAADNSIGVSSS